jgi:membrane-bound lytic murein transglycosylase D
MQLRSALPVAVLLGGVLGAAAVAVSPDKGPLSVPIGTPLLVADATGVTWDLPVVRNAAVERFINLFTHKQSDRMALYLKRSGRYEGMIRAKLRERGMPEDLVYLSMIESGFNPTARSKAQAVGLWQFIEETGERYGLRVDGYVDERRDPEKSTDAALRYLQDLHNHFGSWYLAAAAYNTGENRVSRVMREMTGSVKGEEEDFWRIRGRLPAETREYVPLMVAAALIGKEPHKYGLGEVERYLPAQVETVKVPGGTELETVAMAVGVSEKEIRTLNPQLIRGVTPPKDDTYGVRIPEGRAERFAVAFEQVREEATARAAAEKVEREKLEKERRAKLAQASKASKAPKGGKAKAAARGRTHTVRKGESLWTIARRNDVSVAAIKRANGIRGNSLRPGQKIRIPS